MDLLEKNIPEAVRLYAEVKARDPDAVIFKETAINDFGYTLIQSGRAKEAIEVLKLNIDRYPQSFNAYDSLAEAYMVNGDKELAIKNYKRSLELNPDNKNALEMLKKLGQ